jgi:hypothetical protein
MERTTVEWVAQVSLLRPGVFRQGPFASRNTNRRTGLPDADSRIGEKVANAPGVLALCLNETMVAQAMTGVFEQGGEKLVLPGLGFQTQPFFPQVAIERDADFVGFNLELR